MLVKRGSLGVISYVVYEVPSTHIGAVDGACNRSGWEVIDKREKFKFRFGTNELLPELERALLDEGSQGKEVSVHIGQCLYVARWMLEGCVEMSLEEIFAEILRLKSEGNMAMREQRPEDALQLYGEGIALLEGPHFTRRTDKDLKELLIPLYSNQGLCLLKLQRFTECIAACSIVLEHDRNNVKALYRRGCAKLENREIGSAKRDFLSVLHVEPGNEDAKNMLERVKTIEAEQTWGVSDVKEDQGDGRDAVRSRVKMVITIDGEAIPGLVFELFDSVVPRTVENFKLLAEKYSGCRIFKAAKNQFFQTGDYEYNDGSGGNCAVEPDRLIRDRRFFNDEKFGVVKHASAGVLGMSHYGPNTNQSQFYVTLGPCPVLDGKHVVFGRIVEGKEGLDAINVVASDDFRQARPNAEVVVVSVTVLE